MFLVLLKREILAHLITFRFAVTVVACLLLVVYNHASSESTITRNDWRVTIPPEMPIVKNFCPPEPIPF